MDLRAACRVVRAEWVDWSAVWDWVRVVREVWRAEREDWAVESCARRSAEVGLEAEVGVGWLGLEEGLLVVGETGVFAGVVVVIGDGCAPVRSARRV